MTEKPQKLFPTRSEAYPESSDSDIAYTAAKALISAIPIFGKPTAEVLGIFLSPPISKRRDSWSKDFADDFDALQAKMEKAVTLDDLQNNEVFVSAVVQATRIAVGTHQVEKRQMLRNALLNIAVGKGPEDDELQIFLQMIERFTPTHVKILWFLRSPHQQLKGKVSDLTINLGCPLDAAIEAVLPELTNKKEMVRTILLDLYNNGFTTSTGQNNVIENPAITNSGGRFLDFVLTSPLD